jgi:transcriptional regulator with XRE-family HTH domain
MLNYNKIISDINREKLSNRQIADVLGIAESTFRSRIDRKNMTPDDIDKLSDYFKRPIAYYFDKEDKEAFLTNEEKPDKKDHLGYRTCDTRYQTIAKLVDQCEYFRNKYEEVLTQINPKKTGT